MRRLPTPFVALLALGAVALVAWFVVAGDEGPRPAPRLDGGPDTTAGGDALEGLGADGGTPLGGTPRETGTSGGARSRAGRPDPRRDRLEGRVVGAGSRPLAGATVTLHSREVGPAWTRRGVPAGPAVLTTMSAGDGTFTLRPLPAGSAWQVQARAPGYGPGFAEAAAPGAFVEVRLDVAGTLVLFVVDPRGQPIPQAQAVHTTPDGSLATTTDAQGIARFEALPTGVGQLKVSHPEHRVHTDPFLAVEPGAVLERTVVLEPAGVLRGRVVADRDEQPLADAEVTITVPTAPALPPAAAVRSDGEGRFEAPDLAGARDRIEVRVRRAGYAEARLLRSATDESELLVRLRRGEPIVVRGAVYTLAGDVVAGARVRVGSASGAADGDEVQARTDPRGGFQATLPAWAGPGTVWQAAAESPAGDAGVAAFVLPREAGAPAPWVEVQVGPTGGIVGRVLDAEGAPAVGAEVRLEAEGNSIASARLLLRSLDRDGTSLVAVCDGEGAFELLGLPVATYRLIARRGTVVAVHPEVLTVSGRELATVEVRLVDGPRITGRVLDGAGAALAGVYVRATPEGGAGAGVERATSARTDAEGAFVLAGLLEGAYRVGLTRPGFRQVGGSARVLAGDPEVTLRMEARGVVVLTLREGGRPYDGVVTVELQAERGRGAASEFEGTGMDRAGPRTLRTSDARVTLDDVDPGPWRVRVHTPGGGVATSGGGFEVLGGQTSHVELELKRGASLSGRVLDPGAEAPAATAWVQAWPWREEDGSTREADATRGSARADAEGRYVLTGLGPGRYLVGVWTRDGAQWSAEVRLREGEERHLDLVRPAPGQVEVRVRDAEGQALEGARITLEREGGGAYVPSYQAMTAAGLIQDPADWSARLSTDATGYAEVPLVPPGTYRVIPVKPGWTIQGTAPTVVLGAGGRVAAEVVLEAGKTE